MTTIHIFQVKAKSYSCTIYKIGKFVASNAEKRIQHKSRICTRHGSYSSLSEAHMVLRHYENTRFKRLYLLQTVNRVPMKINFLIMTNTHRHIATTNQNSIRRIK